MLPAVSVTAEMLDVALFQPMMRTLVSPATCAVAYVASVLVTVDCGVA